VEFTNSPRSTPAHATLHRRLSGLEVILDLEVHDRSNPRKSVGKSSKQSAIAKADFVARVNFIQDLLYLLSIEGRRFAFDARKLLRFDLPSTSLKPECCMAGMMTIRIPTSMWRVPQPM
jgi:hypothetical protein